MSHDTPAETEPEHMGFPTLPVANAAVGPGECNACRTQWLARGKPAVRFPSPSG